MDQISDRMRLKDKIIDNISKAIKSIQELLYYQSKDPILAGSVISLTLCNGDLPCHKLCENLDHAFLHGLKKVTHGYWQVIKQLSHKEMVKEIDMLANVTTDLGKGRAWLYASLNEGNLESYIRMLCCNEKLLKKYYAKEALMLDEDRMNILLTHTSALEHVKFQLEFDVPYLDISAYPPRSRTSSEPGDYLHSISPKPYTGQPDSCQPGPEVRASPTEPTSQQHSDSDSASIASLDANSQSEFGSHMKISTISSDSGCPVDGHVSDHTKQRCATPTETVINIRPRSGTPADSISLSSVGSSGDPDRHKRLENIITGGDDEDDGGDSLEVIRVKSKKGTSNKSKKKKQTLSQKDNQGKNGKTSPTENRVKLNSQETDEHIIRDLQSSTEKGLEDDGIIDGDLRDSSSSPTSSDSKTALASITKFDSGIDICDFVAAGDKSSLHSTNVSNLVSQNNKNAVSSESPHSPNNSKTVQAQIESKITELCSVDHSVKASQRSNSVEAKSGNSDKPGSNIATPSSIKQSSDNIRDGSHGSDSSPLSPNITEVSRHSDHGQMSPAVNSHSSNTNNQKQNKKSFIDSQNEFRNDNKIYQNGDIVTTKKRNEENDWLESNHDGDDNFDVYSSNEQNTSDQLYNESNKSGSFIGSSSVQSTSHLKDYMNYILQTPDSPPMDSNDKQEKQDKEVDLSLNLDNNTKLQLMLDIFTHEDENLLKMFVTRENHPEGESGVVFVLISDHCLYLLHYRPSTKKFVLQSSAMLLDLLFISTGINEQTLNIESRGKNNQKQRLWLTPGHQALTQAIVECLTHAVQAASEHASPVRSRFSVESEVPLQTIALRKYISTELHCEAQDVTISDYSLVFWEDPSSTSNQPQDPDAPYKEGTLLLRSHDPQKTHVWRPVYIVLKNSMLCVSNKKSDPRPHSYLGLGGDQCVGCRSTSTTDRAHCVELILAQGGSWFLAAASQAEISEWRHVLCLAVSQGIVENNTLSACTPCCCVLSCNHLFLCHEDMHTKFYRTLGRAHLEDVTGIACGDVNSTYCVIEFESQETGVLSNQWVLYFSSAEDLLRCKKAISAAWREIYQIELPLSPVNRAALQHHCSTFSDQLRQQLTLK